MPDCNDVPAGQKPGNDWTFEEFEELMRCCGENIYGLCCGRLWDVDRIDDAIQETFIDAWKGRSNFEPGKLGPGGLKGWLKTIARNVCNRMLNAESPVLISIGNERSTNIPVNRPFVIKLYVTPSVAIFSVMNMPPWMTLDTKSHEMPTSRQCLRGIAALEGYYEIMLVAEYNQVQATQSFLVTVTQEGDSHAASDIENLGSAGSQGIARAKHEILQADTPLGVVFPPLFGARMDLEWLLAGLADNKKEILHRYYEEQQSDEEIAAALRMTTVNVRQIRRRTLLKLRRRAGQDSVTE